MLERLVARIPAALVLVTVLLALYVALVEVQRPALVVASAPAAVLLVAYFRAGRRQGRRGAA